MQKIGSFKKIFGQKVSMKNFSRKMEKIGLFCEKILNQKIGLKNSSWKRHDKNWTSWWKNFRPENWHEKLKIFWKFSANIPQFLQIVQNFSDILTVFPNHLLLLESLEIMMHWHISGHSCTRWLEFWQCEYDTQSDSPSCIVFNYLCDLRLEYPWF